MRVGETSDDATTYGNSLGAHLGAQLGGERGQNAAKAGESLIEAACQSARPNIIKLNELGSDRPELAKHGERGAGGSRTHDGGFAIRCLSHLAIPPNH